jgi:hypothetical protein
VGARQPSVAISNQGGTAEHPFVPEAKGWFLL